MFHLVATGLFFEVAIVQPFETFAVACFVFGHLVHGVVNSIEVQLFGTFGYTHLVFASAGFGGLESVLPHQRKSPGAAGYDWLPVFTYGT